MERILEYSVEDAMVFDFQYCVCCCKDRVKFFLEATSKEVIELSDDVVVASIDRDTVSYS